MYYLNTDIDYSNRFDVQRFVEFKEGVYDITSSYFLNALDNLPPENFYSVLVEDQYNPPLISYKIYRNVSYWLILMEYNYIKDFMQIIKGTKIYYPSMSSLDSLFFDLRGNTTLV